MRFGNRNSFNSFHKCTISSLVSIGLPRQISTKIIVPPHVATKMFEGAPVDSLSLVPNSKQIKKHQELLQKFYQEDQEFRKIANNLYKAFNDDKVKSIALSFTKKEDLENPNETPFFYPVLISTSLLCGIGLAPFYNNKNFPAYALVNKESTSAISGHQDSMYLKSDDKHLSLIPILLLVNGGSKSKAKTWIKESADIIRELKEKYPSAYAILKQINYTTRARSVNEINYPPHKIIGENDDLNFVSSFIYLPSFKDLVNSSISQEQAMSAILKLKEIVNSKQNLQELGLSDEGVQYLILKNRDALHGRDEVEEDERGKRKIIGIPLQKQKPSTTMRISDNVYRVDENSKSK